MKGGRIAEFKLGDRGNVSAVAYEPASKEKPKTMRPDLSRTPSELRHLRDLFWLFLAKQNLNLTEIEMVCSLANRDRSVIGKRVKLVRAYYAKKRAEDADG